MSGEKIKLYRVINGEMVETNEKDSFFDFFNTLPDMPKKIRNYNTYFIKDVMNSCVKIGKSIDCLKRLKILKYNNPHIEMMFIINIDIEQELHERYECKQMYGEWFNLTEKDIDDIKNEYKDKIINHGTIN